MSGRSWNPVSGNTSDGLVRCEFSFVTNNNSNPLVANHRGFGGQTGSDAAGSVSTTGRTAVASVTWSATGDFIVTLADGYRFIQAWSAEIDDGSDTLKPRIGTIANEGAGNTTPITFHIVVRAMATGTATDSTGRRISIILILKNSGSGS